MPGSSVGGWLGCDQSDADELANKMMVERYKKLSPAEEPFTPLAGLFGAGPKVMVPLYNWRSLHLEE
jgi:hypothetical protein